METVVVENPFMPVAAKILIIAFLLFIVFSLGQGLYFMLHDRGQSDRTLDALKRRIGLSVLLFALLIIGLASGVLPGINPSPLARPPVADGQ
jgi:hypothetical protein